MNIELANELMETRKEIRLLQQREKELKQYFSELIDTDISLRVGTAIVISKQEQTRATYDAKQVTSYLTQHGEDVNSFKKFTTFNTLKVVGV